MSISIVLVGCGKMGGALLTGWLESKVADQFFVVEPDKKSARNIPKGARGVTLVNDVSRLPPVLEPDAIVFAVKPQAMDEVVPAYARFNKPGVVFLSIAAGTTISYFEQALGNGAGVVRVMPNTPAAIGQGMSVLVANPAVGPAHLGLCQAMMAAVGDTAWLGNEKLMDAITAVSGSGPAYVFLLIECLAEAGIKVGLPKDLAWQCAVGTVSGAGALAQSSRDNAATLRKNVTSPGGTTAAALDVLMAEGGLQELMNRAVEAARDRGQELGG